MKNILLLGATGSIGDSVLKVVRQNKDSLNLYGIAAGKNSTKVEEIIKSFAPLNIFIDDEDACKVVSSRFPSKNIFNSEDELLNLIRKNGNQLDGSTAHRMHWTLLNVDKFRSIDGRDLHRSSSSGHPPMESVTITCLPGKLFKGKTEGKCLGPQ